ncbi:MAG: hypothetical protein RMJ28_07005 [Nitrososphaerota archaeon]|nr:hypothetical protein [Candidatus Calditenuaceae archaeon]MDW8073962.1 hypothetical protein [Nitrososphaerota archaeon]
MSLTLCPASMFSEWRLNLMLSSSRVLADHRSLVSFSVLSSQLEPLNIWSLVRGLPPPWPSACLR